MRYDSGAEFDVTGAYRYFLWRTWNKMLPEVTFIMLNPSTADHTKNDPTIKRCINFAKDWGFGTLNVVNLFAYRATDPRELTYCEDPIGAENDFHILQAIAKSDMTVLAWGTMGAMLGRDKQVIDLISNMNCFCLSLTIGGYPKHPLYVKGDTKPIKFTT